MPCTLEPWEEIYEEKRFNKDKYGVDASDLSLVTGLLCEACNLLGSRVDGEGSKALVAWWKDHKRRDAPLKRKARRRNGA